MLSPSQLTIVQAPANSKWFLSGPAGCGKTTAGVERMHALLNAGVAGDSILMLTPQRTLQEPYLDLLHSPERGAGGEVTPATISGLARRMVDLFWPLCAEAAGFARPEQPPVFLSLETSQYYMAHIVRSLLDEGYFDSVTIDRNRLYSQILDNLNKAASIDFPHTQISERLKAAYYGSDPAQQRVYEDAQDCANRFRQYCLEHNLLDFSLQLEIFANILWPQDTVHDYLVRSHRHLIYDNVEEDNPRAHDILRAWLPEFDSALLIFDENGGFRRFLGADVETGWALRELCDEHVRLTESFVMSEGITQLSESLAEIIIPNDEQDPATVLSESKKRGKNNEPLNIIMSHFYPELLDAITEEAFSLITTSQIPPSEIVILAPYLSDALRFALMHRLAARGLPVRSHRPSRSLRDEPASQALLTFAALAHAQWHIHPPKFDVAYAFMQAIEGLDLVRAQLLTDIVYRQRDLRLTPFDEIQPDMQARITFNFGNQYSQIRDWINEYRAAPLLPLDHFLRKFFGEVLSQPGFGFHSNFDSVRVAASLVDSVKNFRIALTLPGLSSEDLVGLGKEYIQMLQDGVIAAQYLEGWETENKNAVLVAPAYTFLLMNRPATIQFWLDVGSNGWFERLSQPLTHPYILTRGWEPGRVWTDTDEVTTNRAALARLISGLLHRCRTRVYLGLSELGESGYEQRGELLRVFQKVLQNSEQ